MCVFVLSVKQDQRVHYYLLKSGKPSQMTQEKIEQLEAHDFSWESENKRSLKWREMYDKLVQFHEGKCNSLDRMS